MNPVFILGKNSKKNMGEFSENIRNWRNDNILTEWCAHFLVLKVASNKEQFWHKKLVI